MSLVMYGVRCADIFEEMLALRMGVLIGLVLLAFAFGIKNMGIDNLSIAVFSVYRRVL